MATFVLYRTFAVRGNGRTKTRRKKMNRSVVAQGGFTFETQII